MHPAKRILMFSALSCALAAADTSFEERLVQWQQQGLPAAPFEARIREARAKRVDDEVLLAALERRASMLHHARTLLQDAGFSLEAPAVQGLWTVTASIMEAGKPPEQIAQILELSGGQSAGRLITLFESGESMRIGGVDPETSHALILHFYERSLSRSEVLRASRSARVLYAEGRRGEDLLEAMDLREPRGGQGGGYGQHQRENRPRGTPPQGNGPRQQRYGNGNPPR